MLIHSNAARRIPSRTVVIGAHGFVGTAIVGELTRIGAPVLSVTRKEVDLLADNASANLASQLRPDDAVVFVSAIAPARNAAAVISNLRMAETVIKALAENPVAHLVYISSDAVYSDDANPVTERSVCHPSSSHGMMHAARELLLCNEVKSPIAILRPSLLYGVRDPHNGYGPNRFRRLAEKNEPITLFGNGEEMRDHVHIDDVARITAMVLVHRSMGILNVATGVSTSFRQVAEIINAGRKRAVAINGTPRQNPIMHRHFDITDCLKAFPSFHYVSMANGLAKVAAESDAN
jgi:nucleoside-diphosphate-sugar epimerase